MDNELEQTTETDDIAKEENELFYFESDHLALKGNREYSEVLKTIVILESIRERTLRDYETLVKLHKESIENPAGIVNKLLNKEPLGIPDMYHIPDVPKIDWKKFNVPIPEDSIRELTDDKNIVSNRVDNQNLKPQSTKHWTTEEQKRLEELLIIYPPEPVELRRFKKIAAALGNRTVKQVCSRVQKYFQKLHKAGLPIPGRIPKNLYDKKRPHKHQKHNHYLWKPSTFFPELDIPVVMNDEDVPGPSQTSSQVSVDTISTTHSQENYLLPNNYHDSVQQEVEKSDSEIQLEILKRVKYEKEKYEQNSESLFQHVGFRCDYCGEEPIVGSRWHCTTCINDSIDYCNDCVISQMFSNNSHPMRHIFVVKRNDKSSSPSIVSESEDSDSDT